MTEDSKKPELESGKIENTMPSEDALVAPEEAKTVDTMPRRSRLSKASLRKSRNTLILSIIGIAAILFLLFRYGIPLISDASFLVGKVTSSPDSSENKNPDKDYVASPRLDELPNATKEKSVKITGTSLAGLTIEIYLNGSREDEIKADKNGDFEAEINLTDGENLIKAKAVKGETKSEFSNSINITVKNKGPELSVDSPGDGSNIQGGNPIEVKGKTDPDSSVTVNDFQAIINSDGSWSYMLTLKDGDNDIKVASTDAAGNKTEKTIRVHYSQ